MDLILREIGTNNIFLTEYKPNRTNTPERLLRMICEIVTYKTSAIDGCQKFFNKVFKNKTRCITKENIFTAIMFNELGDNGKISPQKAEYEKPNKGIKDLLKERHVCVFELTHDKDIVLIEDNR